MLDSLSMPRRPLVPAAFMVALALCAAGVFAFGATAFGTAAFGAEDPVLADRWKDARPVPPEIRKVLVVGITADARARRAFEDRFVTLLRARGAEAMTSYSIVPDLTAERDPAAVLGALFAQKVDGVITVRLAPLDEATAKEVPEAERSAAWRTAMARPERARDYVDAALHGLGADVKVFSAEVAYWSMDDGRRIWAGRFAGDTLKSIRKRATDMARVAIDNMRFEGLF